MRESFSAVLKEFGEFPSKPPKEMSFALARERDKARERLETILFGRYDRERSAEEVIKAFNRLNKKHEEAEDSFNEMIEKRNKLAEINRTLIPYFLIEKKKRDWRLREMKPDLIEDLVQEGHEGLLHAAWNYDADTGNAFATYAKYWIMARFDQFLLNNFRSLMRIPEGIDTKRRGLIKIGKGFEGTDENERARYIAKQTGIDVKEVRFVLQTGRKDVAINKQNEGKEEGLLAILPNPSFNMQWEIENKDLANFLINSLISKKRGKNNRKLADVIKLRFGLQTERDIEIMRARYNADGELPLCKEESYTLAEIAKLINVSRARAGQLEKEAIDYLRSKVQNGQEQISPMERRPMHRRRTTGEDRQKILSLYKKFDGVANKASVSSEYSVTTIKNYWRKAGLKPKGKRGGKGNQRNKEMVFSTFS